MVVTGETAKRYIGAAARATVAAPPEELWVIVADPKHHPELAGSGEPRETWQLGEGPLGVDSRFQSRQRIGPFAYTSTSEVSACQMPRLLRWRVGVAEWQFQFQPVEGGTRVVHGYRWGLGLPAPLHQVVAAVLQWRNRANARGMVGTLRNLARMAGAPEPGDIEVSYEPPSMEDAV